jgi:hypothetical protein
MPQVRKNGGRDSEADDIGQGVELATEFAGGVCQARDASIEPVHPRRQADGFCGNFEIGRRQAGIGGEIHDAVDRAEDR